MIETTACGSGYDSATRDDRDSVLWQCISCETEIALGLTEQPSRCRVCESRSWYVVSADAGAASEHGSPRDLGIVPDRERANPAATIEVRGDVAEAA
jgi:hypothetical protein